MAMLPFRRRCQRAQVFLLSIIRVILILVLVIFTKQTLTFALHALQVIQAVGDLVLHTGFIQILHIEAVNVGRSLGQNPFMTQDDFRAGYMRDSKLLREVEVERFGGLRTPPIVGFRTVFARCWHDVENRRAQMRLILEAG